MCTSCDHLWVVTEFLPLVRVALLEKPNTRRGRLGTNINISRSSVYIDSKQATHHIQQYILVYLKCNVLAQGIGVLCLAGRSCRSSSVFAPLAKMSTYRFRGMRKWPLFLGRGDLLRMWFWCFGVVVMLYSQAPEMKRISTLDDLVLFCYDT